MHVLYNVIDNVQIDIHANNVIQVDIHTSNVHVYLFTMYILTISFPFHGT